MKRLAFTLLLLAIVTTQPVAQTQPSPAISPISPIRTMLDTYCVSCHSGTGRAGGIAFAGIPVEDIGANAEIWEKAVRKLRGRLMPPPGARQPSQAEVDAFIHTLEGGLDSNAVRPIAGHVPIQRMTRTEYGTAIKDLLGVEIDAESLLPTEIEVGGFDNIAAALSLSPAFLDQYIAAARLAAKLAVGDVVARQASVVSPI
jgi:hypothetical protein